MTPFFYLLFKLWLFVILIFVFEKCQNSFSWGPSLWSILVLKIPEFWRWKLWDQNFVPFDSGKTHIKESKEPGFTFSIEFRTKLSDLMVWGFASKRIFLRWFSETAFLEFAQSASWFSIELTLFKEVPVYLISHFIVTVPKVLIFYYPIIT